MRQGKEVRGLNFEAGLSHERTVAFCRVVLGHLFNGQLAGLGTLECLIDLNCGLTSRLPGIRATRHLHDGETICPSPGHGFPESACRSHRNRLAAIR
jgi:hypothetical protein